MGKFSIGSRVIITEDSPFNGRAGTITGVSETSEHILYVQFRDGGPHFPVGDQEMRPASQQCKDCLGRGWIAGPLYAMEGSYKCPTCDGTGQIHKVGPYRLMNGDAETFPTFAEAIAYADRHARTTKNGDNK